MYWTIFSNTVGVGSAVLHKLYLVYFSNDTSVLLNIVSALELMLYTNMVVIPWERNFHVVRGKVKTFSFSFSFCKHIYYDKDNW